MYRTPAVSLFRVYPKPSSPGAHRWLLAAGLAATVAAMLAALGLNPPPGPRPAQAVIAQMPDRPRAEQPPSQLVQAAVNEANGETFPASRVRLVRPADHAPEPFYTQHRVVLRSLRMAAEGAGVRISGDLYTDFECDSAPAAANLARGQVEGLLLDIELRDRTPLVQLDKSGAVQVPRPDPRDNGAVVSGQTLRVSTKGTLDGFGHAVFELPALDRPLAPGLYELRVTLVFASQGRTQQEQIKWCSGFWGAEDKGEVNGVRETVPVMGNRPLHDRYWRDLLEVTRQVSSSATLVVGDTLGKSGAELRAASASSSRKPPNVAIWTPALDVVRDVETLAEQKRKSAVQEAAHLANPDYMAAKLAALQQVNPKATMADAVRAVKTEFKAERDRIDALTAQAGGMASAAEAKALTSQTAAQATVLAELHAIQDRMKYLLWVLLDGVLRYTGWQSLDQPGALAWHAIDRNDAAAARNARLDRAAKLDAAALQARETKGKTQPPELWQAYTAFLRQRDDTPDFDPVNFTRKQEGKLTLKVEAWAAYREKWRVALDKAIEPWLAELDTSRRYANRALPQLVAELLAARDQCECLGYAYEFSIRTTLLKQEAALVNEDWKQAAGEVKEKQRLMDLSRTDRNQVKSRFEAHADAARKFAGLEEFQYRWGAALAQGKPLPGSKAQ